MSNSSAQKPVAVTNQILARAVGATDPVPTESAPTPPAGFVPLTKLGRGGRPQRVQINAAGKAAAELRGSTHYAEQFGTAAPSPTSMADALENARAWSDKLQNAAAWYRYVKQEETLAWRHAQTVCDPFRVPFEFRLARDPSVGDEYPSVAVFLGAAKARAKKGAATRKRNRAAKEAAVAKPAAPAETSAGSATPVADPVKAAAVRPVN
jgi:hypothetical protein